MSAPDANTLNSVATEKLLVKVCGMREPENIAELISLNPDFIGFIFYPKSARYVGEPKTTEYIAQLTDSVKKVGVFVNESFENIIQLTQRFKINTVQLHGNESPVVCKQLQASGLRVLKAFALDENFDFSTLHEYEGACDFFLFDTKGPQHGGNGTTFNWNILNNYSGNTPFFLSGGLDLEHTNTIKTARWPHFRGIDINSRFELEPGLKNISKVAQMIAAFRT